MRILHHVDGKDFKKVHQKKIDEQRFLRKVSEVWKSNWRENFYLEVEEIEEEPAVYGEVIEVPEHSKSNWRKELSEGMTTGGQEIQFVPSDTALDSVDVTNTNDYYSNSSTDLALPVDGRDGTSIVSNGTGSGNNGGFNVGQSYLSFNNFGYRFDGTGPNYNVRQAIFGPFDTSRATTLEITAIVGNGSNGGESPQQPVHLGYTIVGDQYVNLINQDDDGNDIVAIPSNGSGSLQTYSITLPSYMRTSNIVFVLNQQELSSVDKTIDNYGITEIKVKRTIPISVMAPLDTPEAVSFFRVGPTPNSPNYETPEQRYRRITQQLLASKNYTTTKFGSNYPGSNFSGIRGVSASPLGRDGMLSAWGSGIVPDGAWGDYFPSGTFGRNSGIVPDGAWGDYFPSGTFGRADIGSGMAQRSTLSPNKGIGSGMSGSATPAPGTDDYYYKLGGGDYSLQGFQKAGQNKTRQDIIDRGKKLLASNQKYIDSQKQKTTVSKPASKSSGPLGAVKAASLAAAASKAATPKPVSKPISLKGTDLQGRPLKAGPQTPTPPGYKGTFKPGPLTGKDIPKPTSSVSKPSTSNQRVQNFNARMDAARNPNTGGYRDILKPQLGPNKPPASAPKPSLNLTSKQQANIKSATNQLKSQVSNLVNLGRTGTIAALTQLQGSTPQSGAAYNTQQQARAQATANYAAKTGQFGKYAAPTPALKPAPAPAPKPAPKPVAPKPTTTARRK